MTRTQLEVSPENIVEEIVATIDKETNTEAEEDTPLYRKSLQKVLGVAAANRKDKNLRPLVNFVRKRDWESLKILFGQYWYNIRNRPHVKDDCLLIDERIVLPTQLRQTVLNSLHLINPDRPPCWSFPHKHRSNVQLVQGCRQSFRQCKNLKTIIGKQHSFQMEPMVEPTEEV